jgi:hypothetical protein
MLTDQFMNKNRAYIFLVPCAILLSLYGCHQRPEVAKSPENTLSVKGSVHEMNLYPDPPPDFPEHEGKSEFMSYCAICHSLKYITAQPDFPAKTWEAEVNKMIAKYHAPIDSVISKKIVGYLVAIKSKH